MRVPLLNESEFEQNDSLEDGTTTTSRRQFLQTIGLAGVGLALSSKYGLAASSRSVLTMSENAVEWRDRVTGFVFSVCSASRAKAINSRIVKANMLVAPTPRDFHSFFSAPFVFDGMTIDPEKVTCGNGFELRSFPYYDVECPCRSTNDLNSIEIRSICDAGEVERFGCVLAPASQRMPMESSDHWPYRQLASDYGLNPNEFKVEYKRVFTGLGKAHLGYYISHKTRKGATATARKDLLLANSN